MTKETKAVDVDRGLPSVNESRGRKTNKLGIVIFLALVLGVGGGAAWWVMTRLKGITQNATTVKKPAEDQQSSKARVFAEPGAPPPLGGSVPPIAAGQAGPGGSAGQSPAPAGAIPLAGGGGKDGKPAAPFGERGAPPDRPAPIGPNARAPGQPQGAVPAPQLENPYDSGFVVTGDLQPGGTAGGGDVGSKFLAGASKTLEGLTAQNKPSAGLAPADGGKGALTGMLTPTSTPMVRAGMLSNQSLTVAKGTPCQCVLSTRIIAMLPGFVKCRLTGPLYSANGKVILAGRGSEVTGEQSGAMKQGQTRLYVLWSELRTPEGITIPIDSPGADALGAPGIDGDVDNHWNQRIGGALMLSLIQDAFAYEVAKASANSGGGNSTASGIAFQSSQQAGEKIAEKVLDSTINIPPTLYRNHGDVISITIARNLDFSSVYTLEAK